MKITNLPLLAICIPLLWTTPVFAEVDRDKIIEQLAALEKEIEKAPDASEESLRHFSGNEQAKHAYLDQIAQKHAQELRQVQLQSERLTAFVLQGNYRDAKSTLRDLERRVTALKPLGGSG